ncbi:MAG TPA: DUF3426 domain-containing protein [Lysobacter sp.]
MFVPCPHCGFLVALVARADGAPQRCPRCNGLVRPETDATADADPGVAQDEAAPSTSEPAEATGAAPAPSDEAPAPEPAPAPSYEDAIAAAAIGTQRPRPRRTTRPRRKGEPSFARHAVAPTPTRTPWGWHAAVAGLTLLLALQLLLAQRQELASDPRWRPFVAGVCGVLRCQLPAWREPAAFTMLQRNVRPKPGERGVLAVEASFRNDARWPQPWPVLVLSLSDVDGRQVGLRAFAPGEYRGAHRDDDELLPGQSANVTLDVVEPAPRIVAFTFDFR